MRSLRHSERNLQAAGGSKKRGRSSLNCGPPWRNPPQLLHRLGPLIVVVRLPVFVSGTAPATDTAQENAAVGPRCVGSRVCRRNSLGETVAPGTSGEGWSRLYEGGKSLRNCGLPPSKRVERAALTANGGAIAFAALVLPASLGATRRR
jgi:hypothetical protein